MQCSYSTSPNRIYKYGYVITCMRVHMIADKDSKETKSENEIAIYRQ